MSLRSSRLLLAATAGALGVTLVATPAAAAEVPASSPGEAAAGYLLRQFGDGGAIPSFDLATSYGLTADAVSALVAARYGRETVPRALEFLSGATGSAYAQSAEGGTFPGRTGKLALAFAVAGADTRDVDGVDLVDRIEQTLVPAGDLTLPAGLYAEADDRNSPLKHSLAVLGLRATGAVPATAAADFLRSQQCDLPASVAGAFPGQVVTPVDGTTTCGSADVNATAYAVMALTSLADETASDAGLDFLDSVQNADGGFGFAVGATTDAASTGLVVQAVLARGEDPSADRWATADGSLLDALLDLQALEDYAGDRALRGGFRYDAGTVDPDSFTSSQASLAAAGDYLPAASVGSPEDLSGDEPVVGDGGLVAPGPVQTDPAPEPDPDPSQSDGTGTDPDTDAGTPGATPSSTGGPDSAAPSATRTAEPTTVVSGSGTLPVTGGAAGLLVPLGAGAVVAGAVALVAARRRPSGTHQA